MKPKSSIAKGKYKLCKNCLVVLIHHNAKYCKFSVCQKKRRTICRLTYNKNHTREEIRKKNTEWRRKQGVLPRGKSMAEEQVLKKLLKYFKKEDIIKHDNKTILNPNTGRFLELDFYLPKYNLAFEVDGETHRTTCYGEERLKYQIKNDKLKDRICIELGIDLVRIPWGKDINIFSEFAVIQLNYLKKLCQ